MTERRWATEQEAADYARVSGNTLRRWRAQGRLTGYKVGRTVRYDLGEIDAMLTGAATAETPANNDGGR
ncbi:helix-turn-helix domain-containing protein [Mycolicibacterium goodii]|uniref:Helix-turn-helix domain-containing protein n=1 Tax=Mycolicibacterium goodii TaxID=134601 RepID=A0ABS6HN77_MYCGD|nr:helix-turn-helix domain-containing protein [Mycolicibacterium goodii]MBU8824147.1 helix-turn-helix domain-containing protein [Mycolicibacterium goodii]MBU8838070.1 helix-turn-helix domain-containing protein [Mycolicibacterium goodii]